MKEQPELLDLLGAIIVSVISGIISISRRLVNGQHFSILWVISEFLMAILCGYLMFTAYPHIINTVPNWFTLPIAVAFAAHVGGKVFQEIEKELIAKYTRITGRTD